MWLALANGIATNLVQAKKNMCAFLLSFLNSCDHDKSRFMLSCWKMRHVESDKVILYESIAWKLPNLWVNPNQHQNYSSWPIFTGRIAQLSRRLGELIHTWFLKLLGVWVVHYKNYWGNRYIIEKITQIDRQKKKKSISYSLCLINFLQRLSPLSNGNPSYVASLGMYLFVFFHFVFLCFFIC